MNREDDFRAVGPVYAARYLHSLGQGKEANPFPKDTVRHGVFNIEMDRLDVEVMVQEVMQP